MKKTVLKIGFLVAGACFISPIYAQTGESILEDPYMPLQWSHENSGWVPVYNSSTLYCGTIGFDLNIEEAWDYMSNLNLKTIPVIRVGVLDSGLDKTHPDLDQERLIAGKNFSVSPYNSNTTDTYGHGTHVTGAIMATAYNGIGIAGVDRTCKVMPIKIEPACPRSQRGHIAAAIYHAFDSNIRVINMSWGWTEATIDNNIRDAISLGIDNGCIFIGAAGNFNNYYIEKVHFPGRVGIAVGAANPCGAIKTGNTPLTCEKDNRPINIGNGTINWGSNYGDGLDVMGPGTMIPAIDIRGLQYGLSGMMGCWGNCYQSTDGNGDYVTNAFGTSIATPYITGIVSQMLAMNPQLKMHEIEYLLKASTTAMTGGYRWPNAYQAVYLARNFTPQSRPLSDLVVTNVQYLRISATHVRATVTVWNRTNIASTATTLHVYNSSTWSDAYGEHDEIGLDSIVDIPSISGNTTQSFPVIIRYQAPNSQNLHLNAVVDPAMALEEMNKANNARSIPVSLSQTVIGGEIELPDPEQTAFKSGKAEVAETLNLELFPNPAHEQVMLTIELTGNGQLQLLDLLGNSLHQQELANGKQNLLLDTSKLSSGVYLVELKQASGKSVLKKLVIQ